MNARHEKLVRILARLAVRAFHRCGVRDFRSFLNGQWQVIASQHRAIADQKGVFLRFAFELEGAKQQRKAVAA